MFPKNNADSTNQIIALSKRYEEPITRLKTFRTRASASMNFDESDVDGADGVDVDIDAGAGVGVDDDGDFKDAVVQFCCSIRVSESEKCCRDSMKEAGIFIFKRNASGRALRAKGVFIFEFDDVVVVVDEIRGELDDALEDEVLDEDLIFLEEGCVTLSNLKEELLNVGEGTASWCKDVALFDLNDVLKRLMARRSAFGGREFCEG